MNVEEKRVRCWQEFCDAAEAGAQGDHSLGMALVAESPSVAGELRSFITALREGRLVRVAPYQYRRGKRRG